MDSFTQIVLGVAVAHIGLGNKVSIKKTVVLGAVMGTLPDLDVLFAKLFRDPLTEVALHRGFSHSLLFFALLTLLTVPLIRKKFAGVKVSHLAFTVFAILTTHSLLDIFTTWGTQILWPYPQKFALKSIFVIDVAYTLPLLAGVYLGLKKQRRIFTWAAVVLSTAYLGWGLLAQHIVKERALKEFYACKTGVELLNVTVKPTFSNSILWNVILQTPNGFYLSDRSLWDRDRMKFHYFPQNADLIAHIKDENINRLKKISEGQFVITRNSHGLVFNDLRFGLLKRNATEVQFAFSYQLVMEKERVTVQVLPREKRDGLELLQYVAGRIMGHSAP